MTEMDLTLTVNGTENELSVEPQKLLVHVLRDDLGLTGTNIGCETSMCGACTVHMDGDAVKSCTVFAGQADGSRITTIEALADRHHLDPIQESFHEEHGLQCGYCTPGMIMTIKEFLDKNPDPDEEEIHEGIEGNICRCTGYQNIISAVKTAAEKRQASDAIGEGN